MPNFQFWIPFFLLIVIDFEFETFPSFPCITKTTRHTWSELHRSFFSHPSFLFTNFNRFGTFPKFPFVMPKQLDSWSYLRFPIRSYLWHRKFTASRSITTHCLYPFNHKQQISAKCYLQPFHLDDCLLEQSSFCILTNDASVIPSTGVLRLRSADIARAADGFCYWTLYAQQEDDIWTYAGK